jgi:hypothetical protein
MDRSGHGLYVEAASRNFLVELRRTKENLSILDVPSEGRTDILPNWGQKPSTSTVSLGLCVAAELAPTNSRILASDYCVTVAGPRQLSRYSDGFWAGRQGFYSLRGKQISIIFSRGLHSASNLMGFIIPEVKRLGVNLTTHLHPVPRSRIVELSPLPLTPSWGSA